MTETVNEVFSMRYSSRDARRVRVPLRAPLLGAAVSSHLGLATGVALDAGIDLIFTPDLDGYIKLQSLDYAGEENFHLLHVPRRAASTWGDCLRGAVCALQREFPLAAGFKAVIGGGLSFSGLGSSQAAILAYLAALCQVNGHKLPAQELGRLSRWVEREFLANPLSLLDLGGHEFTSPGDMVCVDSREPTTRVVRSEQAPDNYAFLIVQCPEAQTDGLAGGGRSGRYSDSFLARERRRIEVGLRSWHCGSLTAFGQLLLASSAERLADTHETGPHSVLLRAFRTTPGVYGAYLQEGRSVSTWVALVDPSYASRIRTRLLTDLAETCPDFGSELLFHIDYRAGMARRSETTGTLS